MAPKLPEWFCTEFYAVEDPEALLLGIVMTSEIYLAFNTAKFCATIPVERPADPELHIIVRNFRGILAAYTRDDWFDYNAGDSIPILRLLDLLKSRYGSILD